MEGRRSLSKRNQASASEMDEILRGKKKGKQASASEGGEISRGKKAKQASASGGEILMKEKGNQAGASEGASGGEILMKEKGYQAGASEGDKILRRKKENQSSASTEGGEILRRKKEILEMYELPKDTELLGMRLSLAQARTTKRKTKVVKELVPPERIEAMRNTPHPIIGRLFTDDELAERPKRWREAYAKCKAKSEKVRAYYQALIDQFDTKGCAYDEEEVTDDDEMVED